MTKKNMRAGVQAISGFGLNAFSQDELNTIHDATLEVLQDPGLMVESDEAMEIFHGCGARVERREDGGVVRLPPYLVEDCIRLAPNIVVYHGRDPRNDFVAEPKRVTLTNAGCCVKIVDLLTLDVRPTLKRDCEDIGRLCDCLEEIEIFERPCVPTDAPRETYPVHALEAILRNTSKHVLIGADNPENLRRMVEVAAACVGGIDSFRRRPIFTATVCPTSPLSLGPDCCDVVIEAARQGVGLWCIPMALAGATATATLAGTLVTTNAEQLGALVLAQLTSKGTPFAYGNTSIIMDMTMGVGSVGAPELGVISSGAAKLAQYYRLPCIVGSGMSDSKIPDAQVGYESAVSALTAALAGANVIFGLGGLDQLLTFDYAKLIMDVEMSRMITRVVRGIDVTEDALALDVIRQVGPGREYMTHDHTYHHMRELSRSRLFDRSTRDVWEAAGEKDVLTRAYEKARTILGDHRPAPLPEGAEEAMQSVLESYEGELGLRK